MIVDFHCHVWPDHIASRALGGNIPGMDLFGDGTIAGLEAAQTRAGVDRSVCLAVANSPAQLKSANQFAGSLDRDRFIPFGTIHPLVSPEENLRNLRENRLIGVKLHAIFQGFSLDDPALFDTLAALEGEFCVVAHVGDGGGGDGTTCTPQMVATIAKTFPRLALVACHFGGYHRHEEATQAFAGVPIVFDTSWPPSLATLEPSEVRETIRRHGVERVVFASDWPTAEPAAEIAALHAVGLDDDELTMILGENARALLKLDDVV
jgi:predicted TIM-barrel fold metal-dependent hydrolase